MLIHENVYANSFFLYNVYVNVCHWWLTSNRPTYKCHQKINSVYIQPNIIKLSILWHIGILKQIKSDSSLSFNTSFLYNFASNPYNNCEIKLLLCYIGTSLFTWRGHCSRRAISLRMDAVIAVVAYLWLALNLTATPCKLKHCHHDFSMANN